MLEVAKTDVWSHWITLSARFARRRPTSNSDLITKGVHFGPGFCLGFPVDYLTLLVSEIPVATVASAYARHSAAIAKLTAAEQNAKGGRLPPSECVRLRMMD